MKDRKYAEIRKKGDQTLIYLAMANKNLRIRTRWFLEITFVS